MIKDILEKYWKQTNMEARYVGGPYREITCLANQELFAELKAATDHWPTPFPDDKSKRGLCIERSRANVKEHKDYGKAIFIFTVVEEDLPKKA